MVLWIIQKCKEIVENENTYIIFTAYCDKKKYRWENSGKKLISKKILF